MKPTVQKKSILNVSQTTYGLIILENEKQDGLVIIHKK
jgi:hypothetical protein